MCGIVASVSNKDVVNNLISGLHKLEYRGYDSSGIATLNNNKISLIKASGKVETLEKSINGNCKGQIGIAHTRWATHGEPSEKNAHPHQVDNIVIVHNGIIENYESLKENFSDLKSDTDSEIIAHLIQKKLSEKNNLLEAVLAVSQKLQGTYALAVLDKNNPKEIAFAKKGSPLIIGIGENENFLASDSHALIEHTKDFIYLEDGDHGKIFESGYFICDPSGKELSREVMQSKLSLQSTEIGEYNHFMQKEIYEQPDAILEAFQGRIVEGKVPIEMLGPNALAILKSVKFVQIVACGTSYHAALIMKHWLDKLAGIPSHAEVASEFRYRQHAVQDDTLFITISQSGETADTLAALKEIKKDPRYIRTLSVCNVPESSLSRESDVTVFTNAGAEIGVASTKAFTSQLTTLMLIVIALGKNFLIDEKLEKELCAQLQSLPEKVKAILKLDSQIAELAKKFSDKEHALFLGRGSHFPIAREGALKLKEISYIHAEAYPAGELKHGPLALVDERMPVVAVAPNNITLEKLKSNLEEVKARGGKLYIFADKRANFKSDEIIEVFEIDAPQNPVAPILFTVPLQLLAYHCALIKGTNVDQPRNLAKSVTVE